MNSTTLINGITFFALCMTTYSASSSAEKSIEGRKLLVLKGQKASVAYDLSGGTMADFHLNGNSLNPFTWNWPDSGDTAARPMGHFVCFDRWGQPSENELKNGMPFHGEATSVEWMVLSKPEQTAGGVTATLKCSLPIGGMTLTRTAKLSDKSPVLTVKEVIKNENKLGRVYNIVQHPSIAPPFLDENVMIDSNAWKGYMQESPWPNPEEPVIYWPSIAYKGKLVDLRNLTDDHNPGVTSFVFRDDVKYGWVTASNPGKGLLVGYIWDVKEYPWLNIWRNVANGKPAARGLEFGTTGLHRPFKDMLEKQTIFNTRLCEYIDADVSTEKSYFVFLTEIPGNYNGVADIVYTNGKITLKERDGKPDSDIVIAF